jgi:hypothetical protein
MVWLCCDSSALAAQGPLPNGEETGAFHLPTVLSQKLVVSKENPAHKWHAGLSHKAISNPFRGNVQIADNSKVDGDKGV